MIADITTKQWTRAALSIGGCAAPSPVFAMHDGSAAGHWSILLMCALLGLGLLLFAVMRSRARRKRERFDHTLARRQRALILPWPLARVERRNTELPLRD